MFRSNKALLLLALITWTAGIAWFAASWGAVRGRSAQLEGLATALASRKEAGQLPESYPEVPASAAQVTDLGLRLIVHESPAWEARNRDFIPRFESRWGCSEGKQVHVTSSPFAADGLRVAVSDFTGFSGDTVELSFVKDPKSEISVSAEVSGFYDGNSESYTWNKPTGWIIVSKRDWSALSDEHPLYLRFHLQDAANLYGHCVNGFVRATQ